MEKMNCINKKCWDYDSNIKYNCGRTHFCWGYNVLPYKQKLNSYKEKKMKCINKKCISYDNERTYNCNKFNCIENCRLVELEEPKLRPYTWEEAQELIGKGIRIKNDDDLILIYMVTKYNVCTKVSQISFETLLKKYTHKDGSPCGVEE